VEAATEETVQQEAAPDTEQQVESDALNSGNEQAEEPTGETDGAEATEEEAEPKPDDEAGPEETEQPDDAPRADGDDIPTDVGEQPEEPTEEREAAEEAEEGMTSPRPEGEEAPESPKPDGETEEAAETEEQKEKDGEAEGQMEQIEEGMEEAAEEGSQKAMSPIPQSDTFADGERPESPVAVGEKLSREGSPTFQQEDTVLHGSPPQPGTPQPESGDEEEEEYEEYIEQPEYDREQLIERYHQALAERQQYQEQNYQLQHKLAEYFRKKKSDDVRQEADKNVTDQEQRYLKYMANLDELRRQDVEVRENYKHQIEDLKIRCEDKQSLVDDERVAFMEDKRRVALESVNSRSARPIPPKDIEQYLSTENRKEAEVVTVRLENIKLRNKLKKKEQALKSKEELAEGLHLIDFEQLKIENQTYNEKIEERNEELLKLRKKITSTVQVLTHLKEKLQFVQAENHVQQKNLHEVEEHAARKRDILSRTKQARDALRIDNQRLRQNCGLLGNEPLLRDFEERKDESEDLDNKLERLKTLHAELTLNLNGVRKKIEQVRAGQP